MPNNQVATLGLAASLALLLAACASSPPTINLDSIPTEDGLYEVTGSDADEAWAHPDADLGQYSMIILGGIDIEYRAGGETQLHRFARSQRGPFEVSELQREWFQRWAEEQIPEELRNSRRFTLVDEPGPGALLVNLQLLDFVSYLPPESPGPGGLGISEFAEATLVIEIRDSSTEEILVRIIDRRAAEVIDRAVNVEIRFDGPNDARRMFELFAKLFRKRLDEFSELRPSTLATEGEQRG